MRQIDGIEEGTGESAGRAGAKAIRRAARKQYLAEEKIRIVLDGLLGEDSIAELCRREGLASNVCYRWSKAFLEAGKKRLADRPDRERLAMRFGRFKAA